MLPIKDKHLSTHFIFTNNCKVQTRRIRIDGTKSHVRGALGNKPCNGKYRTKRQIGHSKLIRNLSLHSLAIAIPIIKLGALPNASWILFQTLVFDWLSIEIEHSSVNTTAIIVAHSHFPLPWKKRKRSGEMRYKGVINDINQAPRW